jgi:hypothetical protein
LAIDVPVKIPKVKCNGSVYEKADGRWRDVGIIT